MEWISTVYDFIRKRSAKISISTQNLLCRLRSGLNGGLHFLETYCCPDICKGWCWWAILWIRCQVHSPRRNWCHGRTDRPLQSVKITSLFLRRDSVSKEAHFPQDGTGRVLHESFKYITSMDTLGIYVLKNLKHEFNHAVVQRLITLHRAQIKLANYAVVTV